MTDEQHETFEILVMKSVDGLLKADEQEQLDQHLETCAECRAELTDYQAIKETTDIMTQRILADANLEPFRATGVVSMWLALSYGLLLFGALLLVGYGAWHVWFAPMPIAIKLGLGTVSLGGLALLLYVLRLRWLGKGRDPYSEVDL